MGHSEMKVLLFMSAFLSLVYSVEQQMHNFKAYGTIAPCAIEMVYTKKVFQRSRIQCGFDCKHRDECRGFTYHNNICHYFNTHPTKFDATPGCITYERPCEKVYYGVDPNVNCTFPFSGNGAIHYSCANADDDVCTKECMTSDFRLVRCDPSSSFTQTSGVINNASLAAFPLITYGPWIVIQNRPVPNHSSFNKNFAEYESGFILPDGDYWMGLAGMHNLTSQGRWVLRLEAESLLYRKWSSAEYIDFKVDTASTNYKLWVGTFMGGDTDVLKKELNTNLNGMPFYTSDRSSAQCGYMLRLGGWWMNQCSKVNLNSDEELRMWYNFPTGDFKVRGSRMLARPVY